MSLRERALNERVAGKGSVCVWGGCGVCVRLRITEGRTQPAHPALAEVGDS